MFRFILSLIFIFSCIPFSHALTIGDSETPRILFLGDSITYGEGDSTVQVFGYRDHAQLVYGASDYTTVGPYKSPGSDGTYGVKHLGLSGQRADEMITALPAQLLAYMPKPNPVGSAIVLHIGSNDLNSGGDTGATLITQLESIVNIITAYDSSIKLFICQIIPSTTGALDTKIVDYNTLIDSNYTTIWSTNPNIHIIDAYTGFQTCNSGTWSACMSDFIHPNATGYATLGTVIGTCIEDSTDTYCDNN